MFKNLSVMEVKVNGDHEERMHRYTCAPESPLGEVHDALCTMLSHVIEQMKARETEYRKQCEKACEAGKECAEKPKDK